MSADFDPPERRGLFLQYRTAGALAEALTPEEAAPEILEAVCSTLGWELGAFWVVDEEDELLRCASSWTGDRERLGEFEEASRRVVLGRGEGLPGRVWEAGAPAWIVEVTEDSNFPRVSAAARWGLRGAFAFPVTLGDRVLGVMEFFGRRPEEPDEGLSAMMASIGSQIGQVIERRRIEERVRRSEGRLRAILGAALDAVIAMNHRGEVVEWNPAAEQVFGYRAEEVEGRRLAELIIPPELREAHERALERHLETEETRILGRRVELTGMRSDGSRFPVELAITRADVPGPPMFVGHVRDLTEVKRVEQAIRVGEERLRQILTTTAAATWEWDVEEDRMSGSENLGPMLGLARGEVPEGMGGYLDLVHPEDRREVEGAVGRAVERGEDQEIEFRIVGPDGRTRWLHVPIHVIADGATVRLAGLTWDITRRRRGEEQARFLADAAEVLSSSLDPQGLLRELARLAVPGVADWCVVHLLDPGGTVEGVAVAHRDPELERRGWEMLRRLPFPAEASAGPAKVLRSGKAELYETVVEELVQAAVGDPEASELMEGLGLASAMVVPLVARRRVLGTISLATDESGRRYGEEELAFAEELARRAGVAIENAVLYRAERESRAALETARERVGFLSLASDVLAGSLDYERTLADLSELVVPRLADWCTINLVEEDGSIRRVAAHHRDPDKQAMLDRLVQDFPHDPESDSGVPRAIRFGEAILLEEVDHRLLEETAHGDEYLRLTEELGIASCIVVPLAARERTLGTISLVYSESGRRYGSADLALAEDLGRRAAMAIDNARLFRDRDYIARTLQRSLLPPYLPTIPGVGLASRYRSMGETVEVGGDFYDGFQVDPNVWALVVGDVQGKGPDAAAVVGLVRHTLRIASVHDQRPSRALASLNAALLRGESDRFCTVVLAFARRRGRRLSLTVSCGGHPPPLVLRKDGSVETLEHSGMLLGSFESPELVDISLELGPGETIVLYTDGIAGGEGEDLAELARFLEGRQRMSAERLAEGVLGWAEQRPGRPRDDAALMVVRTLPVASEERSVPFVEPSRTPHPDTIPVR